VSLPKILLFIILTTGLFALSKEDRIIRASLYPYVVKGITYYPHKVSVGEYKKVKTSWYGEYFHGRKTANGEIYDMYGYTAAHKTYPLGTVLMVRNPKNSKSLKVRINDRGPFWNDRELDLSMGAAEFLGTKREGVAMVTIEVISVPSIAQSFTPIKGKKPKKASYNVGYTAMSYSLISDNSKKSRFEIGIFQEKKEASKYLKKFKKYFPKAYLVNENDSYKVSFLLSSNEIKAIMKLKNLKKMGLITGYGLCWSYD
jgi:rare lipoprotein A